MGLDMYIDKKTYVQNWNHTKKEKRHEITVVDGNGNPVKHIKPHRITYLEEEVWYRRKAYHLDKWFQDNLTRDGGYVEEDDIKSLIEVIDNTIASIKGSDSYDANIEVLDNPFVVPNEVRIEELEKDKADFKDLLQEMQNTSSSFLYRSSW